ncbi:MAG: ABC transporter permease [Gorillibacterium sp.]|nr:ABC transporter permease [Gorillibacterium sp.]
MSVQFIAKFLKQPIIIVGMITAILFQVFFSLIWITGYDHVTDRVDQLPIAIVNEDGAAGQLITDGIAGSLKFQTDKKLTLNEAKDALEKREIRMIINIPQGFTSMIHDPSQSANIRYFVNESNPQMVTNVMETAANQITMAVNAQTSKTALEQTLIQMNLPESQVQQIKDSTSDHIISDVQITHPATNFSQMMVPLMFITASFTGAMFLSMSLNNASINLSGQIGKWQRLTARFMIMGGVSLIVSVIGASMIYGLGIRSSLGFMAMWMFEFLILLISMTVAQLSMLLLGEAGAWLNVGLLSLQMVSSGATIPREVLSPFYIWIGQFFPAQYAVDGMMDLIIGGSGLWLDVLALIYIGVICTLLSVILTTIRRDLKPTRERANLSANV